MSPESAVRTKQSHSAIQPRGLIAAALLQLMALLSAAPTDAVPMRDIAISTSHNDRIAPVGSSIAIEFLVSGLGNHMHPSVGAYDLLLRWDNKRFDFTGVSFSQNLGPAVSNLRLLGITGFDSTGFEWATFGQQSVLSPSALAKLQPNRFVLATTTFDVLAVSPHIGERIGGNIGFGFAEPESGVQNFVLDAFGTPFPGGVTISNLSDPNVPPAPVPEPATLFLVGTTAAGIGFVRWRRERGKRRRELR